MKSGKIVKTNNITLDKRNEIREIRQTYTLWWNRYNAAYSDESEDNEAIT